MSDTSSTGQESGSGQQQRQESQEGTGAGEGQRSQEDHQEGTGNETGAGQQQGQEPTAQELAAQLERMQQELARTRQEAAGYRTKLRDHEQSGMSEQERMSTQLQETTAELDRLRGELATRELRDEATDVATTLGFRDPRLAHRLVDRSTVTDDAGAIDRKKLQASLAAELKEHPYLGTGGAGGDAAGGRTRTRGSGASMNDLIREQARKG